MPGLSKTRLDRLQRVLRRHTESGGVPGLVALIDRGGDVHVETHGHATAPDAEHEAVPVARDTIFRIASLTKPITAAAAMILVEECVLRLDDPVDELLPELADRQVIRSLDGPVDDTVPAERPITLRDLLTFRAGYGMVLAMPGTYPYQRAAAELGFEDGPPDPSLPADPDSWLARLGRLPLLHQPGAGWHYNTGSDILGVLIARASGRSFGDFLRERVFEPLGMRDTGFVVPPASVPRLATAYAHDRDTGGVKVFDEAAGGRWTRQPAFETGGGGLASTVDDFRTFSRMLLDHGRHGGDRLLSRASVELMTANHLPAELRAATPWPGDLFDAYGWGFGVSVVLRRDRLAGRVGAYGWDGGLGTTWLNDPAEDAVSILFTQKAWETPSQPPVSQDFLTGVYQALDD